MVLYKIVGVIYEMPQLHLLSLIDGGQIKASDQCSEYGHTVGNCGIQREFRLSLSSSTKS
jgi:hypothetical protein